MKKLLLAFVLFLAGSSSFGQGTIKFNNRLTGLVDAPITAITASGHVGIGSVPGAMAQLYLVTGATYTPLTPATTFRTTSAAAMYYVNEPTSSVIVPGVPAGDIATIVMRVWVGGSSYGDPLNIARGQSNPILVSLGGVPAQGAPIPDAVLSGLEGFGLIVPEPSTIALGVLGAAALLYRRRK